MSRDAAGRARQQRGWRGWQRRWKDRWLAEGGAAARRGATLDMLVFDHGLLRLAWRNFHEIDTGVWRGSQPDPATIRKLAARGFATILNLRGETEWGSYLLERETCRELGMALIDVKLNSRALPQVETILGLDAIFAEAARPMLLHCKSGSDRAGFASALYLLLRRGASASDAKAQLSWRYLHLRSGGTGVLGYMIDAYAAEAARDGIGFRDWLSTRYDREALQAAYRGGAVAGFVTDRLLGRE